MTTPTALRQAYLAVREKLLEYENVIGVGFGAREQGGLLTKQLAIIALVGNKRSPEELSEEQLLPRDYRGIPIDVREPRFTEKAHLEFLKRNGIPAEQGECNMDHFFLSDRKIHRLNQERLRQSN
ncbi:MAG: hypothetical protein WA783_10085, partial [Phormidesmis sp.]